DPKRGEVAKDVAAFANHVGGVIVIGIADVKGVASKLTPIEDADDGEIRRLRSLIASRVHPLPAFDIFKCDSTDEHRGYLLITVPRSRSAPQAVSDPTSSSLTYWARYGSQTQPLAESAIADRYRNRFEAAESRVRRVDALMAEGIGILNRS